MADNQTITVLIEIPEGSNIKYERDEDTGMLMVDRIMHTSMTYPVNYGAIPDALGEDGDPLDALLFISRPIMPGVGIKARVIGVLEMEDEEGVDHKLIVVPAKEKIDPICGAWQSLADIPAAKKAEIKHFFEHYKDLEPEKWVKINDWQDATKASEILAAGFQRQAK